MNISPKSAPASGICVTLAILCSAASAAPAVDFTDLDYFQIDCSRRTEQIAFLQSLRSTADDRLLARAANALMPWRMFTNPAVYNNNAAQGSSRTDWVINQKLMALRDDCRSNP
jgi:hypothetical protein